MRRIKFLPKDNEDPAPQHGSRWTRGDQRGEEAPTLPPHAPAGWCSFTLVLNSFSGNWGAWSFTSLILMLKIKELPVTFLVKRSTTSKKPRKQRTVLMLQDRLLDGTIYVHVIARFASLMHQPGSFWGQGSHRCPSPRDPRDRPQCWLRQGTQWTFVMIRF